MPQTLIQKRKAEEESEMSFPPPGTTHLFMSPTEEGACLAYSFNSNSTPNATKILEIIAKVHDIENDADQINPASQVFSYLVTKSGFVKNAKNQCLYKEEEDDDQKCPWVDELGEDVGEWAYFNEVHRFKNPGNIIVSLHTEWC